MIWNIDYETFYSKHIKCFKIFAANVGDKSFDWLMRACRLKPYSVFEKGFNGNTFHRWWVDEWDNSIVLEKDKLVVILNDPNIKKRTNTKTDLFFGRSIPSTVEQSQTALLIDNRLVCYGHDEFLRAFELPNKRIAPISIGIDNLKQIKTSPLDQKNIFPLQIKGMKEKLIETINQGKLLV